MPLRDEPLEWDFNAKVKFFPIYYQGVVVGFFNPEYAGRIVKILNEDENLRKALKNACLDLLKEQGGDSSELEGLMKKYISGTKRPQYGTKAIAFLLRERQAELDISDREFARFCDSYRLSWENLQNIYAGKAIEDSLIIPLSRILGKSPGEVIAVRDGSPKKR
ncbi:MAG: hypothetical protein SAL07_08040 [Oscillatoria sp. PMC 1051.18]|uniref:hypothetical protein n=1 Tax=Oscillatoria salina TaxID=331517 RepID=UPI0013B6CE10|nr:hypothetical protein [Oscillatoria salina]MBZ8181475.1 hypothetical protein [Oscillatoria salina IIICB1]MEC4892520.1 hypothetical protein [Oscillatoria sp. PMC 1050.18]MEC5029847.1 hypothetical protein [Oscillatoria sp. PMC 1051.18]NET90748.1 hypothetical protein [Kamptonema sp. SIO1D9]